MSKFNYTLKKGQASFKARLDTDIVANAILVEKEDGNVLILQTTLEPVEEIQNVPHYKVDKEGNVKVNAEGQPIVAEYRPTKVKVSPVVELTVQEEIDAFLAQWS